MLACLGALACAQGAGAATHRHHRGRIIGGQPVPAGVLPQLAYITDSLGGGEYESCTGTVLSSNVVLTAGHCAEDDGGTVDPASGFDVITGQPNLAGTLVGHRSAVSQVIPYPLYDPMTHDGDAALLELSTPTTAPAITLAPSGQTSQWQSPTEVAIAGWGLTDGSDPYSQPAQVQWATTTTRSATYCTQAASLASEPFDAAGQLCAIDTPTYTTGICSGDSGGPMLVHYLTPSPIEIGINAWDIGSSTNPCNPGWPDFFTSTSSISGWAESWVSAHPPPTPVSTPTPTPSPNPTATPKPTQSMPRAGHYFGHSSQNKIVKLTVADDTVDRAKFNYRLRCSRQRSAGWGGHRDEASRQPAWVRVEVPCPRWADLQAHGPVHDVRHRRGHDERRLAQRPIWNLPHRTGWLERTRFLTNRRRASHAGGAGTSARRHTPLRTGEAPPERGFSVAGL